MLVAVGVGLALTLLMAAILDDRHRAGFFVLVLVLVLLASDDRLAIALLAVGVVLLIEGIARRGRPLRGADLIGRVLTGVAFIVAVAIGLKLFQTGSLATAAADIARPALPALGPAAPGLPDMYVFLLDAYPGDRAAAHSATFDADAFPAALETRGFDVVRDAHSNYLLTPLTLASMLSMRHLADIPELGPPHGPMFDDWRHLRAVLDDSAVFAILRAAGYEVVAVDGGYAHAELRAVDRFIEVAEPAELERALMHNTHIDEVIDLVSPGTVAGLERARINDTFGMAGRLAAEPHDRPRFVFVHVPAPHPPWVFEADGSPRNPAVVSLGGEPYLSDEAELAAGFAQATHIGRLAIDAIDAVRSASSAPPVIVVMSDHGPSGEFSTVKPFTSDIQLRASNFLAALTPDHPDLLAERPTPVNLFGTLLGAYLGTPTERRPDTIWAWKSASYLDVVEVPPITGWTP